MRIAFLSTFFVGEYGVTRVVAAQMPLLVSAGHQVDLYACFLDKSLVSKGVRSVRVPTHFKGLRECIQRGVYDVVIACTEQFFSLIADWHLDAITVAYEHGYIPVELTIPAEQEQHRKMIEERINRIYPAFNYVVTISQYAVDYIRWPKAFVLYNGADHFAKVRNVMGTSGAANAKEGPIRVLAVSRYREVEWEGKGLDDLCRLKKDLGDKVDITIVGGGDEVTSKKLADAGIRGLGIIRDPVEMAKIYADSDVLVSFSRCEMFNLPLAEAGFAHKPALALNVCAHPEVTPFVFNSYELIRGYLAFSTAESLHRDGEKMFQFVDAKFRWEMNATRLQKFLEGVCPNAKGESPKPLFYVRWYFWTIREFVRSTVIPVLKKAYAITKKFLIWVKTKIQERLQKK
ncbi:MAG: glycosyltransferase family 4 protein [Fibrobacter sp.]|nr:glycosyltransferase family 4 protein [Fibrobacter sp.]